jgi:hypothetical protein
METIDKISLSSDVEIAIDLLLDLTYQQTA